MLDAWCGVKNSGVLTSSGGEMFLRLKSDESVEYSGLVLNYFTVGDGKTSFNPWLLL